MLRDFCNSSTPYIKDCNNEISGQHLWSPQIRAEDPGVGLWDLPTFASQQDISSPVNSSLRYSVFIFVLSGVEIAYIWGWKLSPNFYTCVLFGHLDSFFPLILNTPPCTSLEIELDRPIEFFHLLISTCQLCMNFKLKSVEKKNRNQFFFISLNKALLRLNKIQNTSHVD